MPQAYAAAAAAAIGGIAGGQKKKSSTSENAGNFQNIRLQDFATLNQGRSGLEADAYNSQVSGFQDLLKLLSAGPGQQEVQANTAFQNDFASQLQSLFNQQANPNQAANFAEAQKYFQPQQVALNQQFEDQMTASNRLAARLGRGGADPILRNKLLQEQSRQQTMLNAQIGDLGMRMPAFKAGQLMDIGGQLANLRQGLASQALQNRQTLMAMGGQLAQQERNYRLAAANRSGGATNLTESIGGGGFRGAVEGGFAGASAVMGGGGAGGGGGGMAGLFGK